MPRIGFGPGFDDGFWDNWPEVVGGLLPRVSYLDPGTSSLFKIERSSILISRAVMRHNTETKVNWSSWIVKVYIRRFDGRITL